jgi:regulator of sirC expression with transglutaminase-like and TPR domain
VDEASEELGKRRADLQIEASAVTIDGGQGGIRHPQLRRRGGAETGQEDPVRRRHGPTTRQGTASNEESSMTMRWFSGWRIAGLLSAIACAIAISPARADQPGKTPAEQPGKTSADQPTVEPAEEAAARSVEDLARAARDAVVLVAVQGRDGRQRGLGTGFVVSEDGLIATNHHVIGEGRPISVQLANGKTLDVTAIHASDRERDLVILRIGSQELVPLPLGDSDRVQDGESIVAMGHPLGLKHSVVGGVVSGRREVDQHRMLQLAIPIESGNSGGPVLDKRGRVIGIVTMKSLVTNNLGFAVEINELKSLLARPNPIPMERWMTIHGVDSQEWATLLGAQWRQRGGKISVSGGGDAFGRSLCLWQPAIPETPFEIAVTVRLDDESGAAGLAFYADGENRHYGFYPSNGKLRFSRFDGPVVQDWNVLHEIPALHYRPGDWNRLKVRVEADRFLCFVNDQQVLEVADGTYRRGKAGLVKFRQTEAEFKRFEVAASLPPSEIPEPRRREILGRLEMLPPLASLSMQDLDALKRDADVQGADVIQRFAQDLERRSRELRQLAGDLRAREVLDALRTLSEKDDQELDLLQACLLIAKLDDPELDVDSYVRKVERMAKEIQGGLAPDALPRDRLAAIDRYLFQENGFHGSRFDYYQRANSHLHRLLDDREGLPLTLSILYQELGRRLGIHIEGIPAPGHFVVRFVDDDDPAQSRYVDVFEGGKVVQRDELLERAADAVGRGEAENALHPATRRQMLRRMLGNLTGNAQRENDAEAMIRYYDALVLLDPDAPQTRFDRARLRFQTGRHEQAIQELEWFLENRAPGIDPDGVRAIQEEIRRSRRG